MGPFQKFPKVIVPFILINAAKKFQILFFITNISLTKDMLHLPQIKCFPGQFDRSCGGCLPGQFGINQGQLSQI